MGWVDGEKSGTPMPLSQSDTEHLLRRVGFGPTAADTARFVGRDLDDVLDEMFAKSPAVPSMPGATSNADWYTALLGTVDWWVDRMADVTWVGGPNTPSPLLEKLALFWHSHFACGTGKVRDVRALWRQMVAYWEDGLGDFEDLLRRVMLDGGMLAYFDNHLNRKGRPQENLARELMELHTCGVGSFTENDVINMAKAWTGHGVGEFKNPPYDFRHRFRPRDHDKSMKELFGLPPRRWDADDTMTELVKGEKQDATARFIVTKLWRYYVNDDPTTADIDALVLTFINNGMRVEPVLRALFTHPTFWAAETRFGMIRQPIEWSADILRRFGISSFDAGLTHRSKFMGQGLFRPPNVAGWGTNEYWISTTAVWGKARFLRALRNQPAVENHFAGIETGTRTQAVDRILDTFGVTEPSAASEARIGEWFDGLVADAPWAASKDAVYIGGLLPEVQAG